ncbi:hypothetical protein GCM10009639_18990 [Kitasatospora putterlickiae]|uniref:Uncharacterized protein n=1 Tax=Kitasatospora putterlickiae TaxID=221725 RepID=A0ABP4IGT0_9ACTN
MDVLWAHCRPADGLQHVSAQSESGRLDLLLYFLTPNSPGTPRALELAHALITRTHRISPWLNRRYLAQEPLTTHEGINSC